MGNYLNPGNEKFRRMIQSEIYVDKTGMIKYTNSVTRYSTKLCLCQPSKKIWEVNGCEYADSLLQPRL